MLLTSTTTTLDRCILFLLCTTLIIISLGSCRGDSQVSLPLLAAAAATTTTTTAREIAVQTHKDQNEQLDLDSPVNSATLVSDCGFQSHRLATRIKPIHYGLFIVPDLRSLTYEGAVQINLQVSNGDFFSPTLDSNQQVSADDESGGDLSAKNDDQLESSVNNNRHQLKANQIVLHADESLNIERVWYRELIATDQVTNVSTSPTGEAPTARYIAVSAVCRDPALQLLVVSLEEELQPGARGQLHLTFGAPLATNMRGFYRSAYLAGEAHNETHYLAVTQFQATQARKAFPCFDEPAMKATYELVLLHSSELNALANTQIVSQRDVLMPPGKLELLLSANQTLVHFARTPPMSSYLLAFAVGRFDYLERKLVVANKDKRQIRVRVYTVPGRKQEARLALETACRAILLLQDYFQIEYPLTKLDLLAVPDFEAGAMENWGLITFKDSHLLCDDLDSAPETKLLVRSTVIHELAHQWFGNLLTMDWWNELWLNEGFATWMEYELLDQMDSSLELPVQYLLDSHIHALTEDSFRSAHAVRPLLIETPDDIEDLFDAISYNKAAAIIRQLHQQIIKPEPFQKALQVYLNTHLYGNANTRDLSSVLEKSSAKGNIGPLLESWLSQPGHPLISVQVDVARNELLLRQERFLSNVANLSTAEANQRWLINVAVLLSDGQGQVQISRLMEPNEEANARLALPVWFELQRLGNWVKLNAHFFGLYRVHYSEELWLKLREPLESDQLEVSDRINLVDDTHALVLANKCPVKRLLELLIWSTTGERRRREKRQHGAVMSSIVSALLDMQRLFEQNDLSSGRNISFKMTQFTRRLLTKLYQRDWQSHMNSTGNLDEQVRKSMDRLGAASMLQSLVQLDEPEATRDALHLFEESAASGRPLASFIRRPVYVAVARAGKDVHFERLMGLMNSTASREERTRLARSIARAKQRSRLQRLWQWLQLQVKQIGGSDALEGEPVDLLSAMVHGGSEGRRFVLELLESELPALVALNEQQPLNNLVEVTYLAGGSRSLVDMEDFFERHKRVTDWTASRGFVQQTLAWQAKLVRSAAENQLETQLDLYLSNELA